MMRLQDLSKGAAFGLLAVAVWAATGHPAAGENDPHAPIRRFARPKAPLAAAAEGLRFPGEFEPQAALLLAGDELAQSSPGLLAELVRSVRGTPVLLLASTEADEQRIAGVLGKANLPAGAVRVLRIAHDTQWARDFGPIVVERQGQGEFLDVDYFEADRRNDDLVPGMLAPLAKLPVRPAPLRIEGGNLLSNGRGLALATSTVLPKNADRNLREKDLQRMLRDTLGVRQATFLEPLVGEPTGHADMFCTFLSPDTVVVGQYDPQVDPVNAAVLDRNAVRLATLRWNLLPTGEAGAPAAGAADARLRVLRIPMASRRDGAWRSYTNVVFANDVLLCPQYPDVSSAADAQALAFYRRHLPGKTVIGLDASPLIARGGALHCIALNLRYAGRLLQP